MHCYKSVLKLPELRLANSEVPLPPTKSLENFLVSSTLLSLKERDVSDYTLIQPLLVIL